MELQPGTTEKVERPSTAPLYQRAPDPNIRNIETITIKWKRASRMPEHQPPTADELKRLIDAARLAFPAFHDRGYGRTVFRLPEPLSVIEAEHLAERIRALPEIEYVAPSVRGRLMGLSLSPPSRAA
jgi:hypothetical protein